MIRQTLHEDLLRRLKEKRRFIQVLAGPRQGAKTTLARQVVQAVRLPAHYAWADSGVRWRNSSAVGLGFGCIEPPP
jgi:hypothetical protein